jgi:hypothetical protein
MPLKPKPISHSVVERRGPWLVVGTKPKQEGLVMSQIRADQFDVYRPMALVSRDARYAKGAPAGTTASGHARVLVPEAIFPGMLFVQPRPEADHHERLHGKAGLAYVLRHGVHDDFIKACQAEEHDGLIHILKESERDELDRQAMQDRQERMRDTAARPIEVGDEVETLDGLIRFVVSEMDGDARVKGLSQFMGGNCPLIVPIHKVIRVAV